MTRSARRSARARPTPSRPVTAVSEPSGANTPAATNGAAPVQAKPGRHREATLYHALAGAGAGDGRTLAQLREAALAAYEASELPVWRRSGFWTTSLQSLDLDALATHAAPASRRRAGRRDAHAARAPARRADRAERRLGRARRARPGAGRARA